ncbi:MAG: LysE family translocator [Paracoccaceae bacterium]|jgi:threonine/homoserine/homoserine lactone efflux protein|nr:LysE family translocator [Paracoccaceae bacterium]
MTIGWDNLSMYCGALVLLFITPGPVWVALVARAMSGGFRAAWPLAIGVALGDLLWPLCAVFGLTWVLSIYGDFLGALRWVAASIFVIMGYFLLTKSDTAITSDPRLTKPGLLAGFLTGVVAVTGNPKAILFYMGVLPGFFDLTQVSWRDTGTIIFVSMAIPMIGNLLLSVFVSRARGLLTSPKAMSLVNKTAGGLLVAVAGAILLT